MASTHTAVAQNGITTRDEYEHLKRCLLEAEQFFGIYCSINSKERVCDSSIHLLCHDYIDSGLRTELFDDYSIFTLPASAKIWLLICMDVFIAHQVSYACFAPLEAALSASAGIEPFNADNYCWNDKGSTETAKRFTLQTVLAEAVAIKRFDNMDHRCLAAYVVNSEIDQVKSELNDGSLSTAELIRELKGEDD